MSSFSVRFLTIPPLSHPRTWHLSAATPAVVPVSTEVDASRLEPRVEQKDGYWVLKEEYRGGINPQEKVKLQKEPMSLFMEGGIDDLANMSLEEIDSSKLTKDDIDVRLKWLGLFHRRKHHCKFFCFSYFHFTSNFNQTLFSCISLTNCNEVVRVY